MLSCKLSPAFVQNADDCYANNPHVKSMMLDLNALDHMDVDLFQKFDIAIATNVLHATQDIKHALGYINLCLKQGGILIAIETTQCVPLLDFVFGLTTDWWSFNDSRTSHPLLTCTEWDKQIAQTGFSFKAYDMHRASAQSFLCAKKTACIDQRLCPRFLLVSDREAVAEEFIQTSYQLGCSCETVMMDQVMQAGSHLQKVLNNKQFFAVVVCLSSDLNHYQCYERAAYLHNKVLSLIIAANVHQVPVYVQLQQANGYHQGGNNIDQVHAMSKSIVSCLRAEHPKQMLYVVEQDSWSVDNVMKEILSKNSHKNISYYANKRYELQLVRLDKDAVIKQDKLDYSSINWVVAGGFGGIGHEVLLWLAQQGARQFIVLSRSASAKHYKSIIKDLKTKYNAEINCVSIDIADSAKMAALALTIHKSGQLEYGFIHLAGVLRDKPACDLNENDFLHVFRAKVYGTLNLLKLAEELKAKAFIAFSSATSIFGNAGQANHASANAFMDSTLYNARGKFDYMFNINWGPWLETGSAKYSHIQKYMHASGVVPFTNKDALKVLQYALTLNVMPLIPINIDWKHFNSSQYDYLLDHGAQPNMNLPGMNLPGMNLPDGLLPASSGMKSHGEKTVHAQVMQVLQKRLSLAEDQIDNNQGLFNYGVDSLLSIVIAKDLSCLFSVELDATVMLDYPTVADLVSFIENKLNSAAGLGGAADEELLYELASEVYHD